MQRADLLHAEAELQVRLQARGGAEPACLVQPRIAVERLDDKITIVIRIWPIVILLEPVALAEAS